MTIRTAQPFRLARRPLASGRPATALTFTALLGSLALLTALPGEARASECTETDVATLTAAPYASHWDAYDGLACLEEHFLAAGDRRAIFASVYTLTTLRMAESIDAGDYQDTAWMQDYQTEFANHYRQALHDRETGNSSQVPQPWTMAFDAAATGNTLIIQDVLLGMNAHINFDLAFAVENVGISPGTSTKYADHTAVNAVLGEIGDEIIEAMCGVYGSSYAALDAALGPADELLLAAGMGAARQNAWNNAVALTNSRFWNRWIVELWIGSAASGSAALILAPTLTPSLLAILKNLEGSDPGSAFCAHFPCSS
jgi:hypothetical protein